MKETIEKLNEALKDPEYRYGWVSNIAMSYKDTEYWYRKKNNKVGKYLNRYDKHIIANEAAENFLKILAL